ncbi:hypothetical protein BV25DRAFT_1821635 [Artomyces pyxidatus]|uniref:Uncharacterized protein n=1 Tax=Artomyces pyxidatus TaxID=48021 RepID=A0ACB8TCP0_9AGAM|nr:hypothetical protein BV25DRAFT_1821635 [Artomyces pyxidatus]
MADSEINRVAGGHKAAMKNPNTSEEAKEHSRQQLNELEQSGSLDEARAQRDGPKNENNVLGGYKATLKNPNVSDEAKQRAQQVLEDKDAL